MNQVKLGIIGLGNMGSGHCNNILAGLTPELKLTAAQTCGSPDATGQRRRCPMMSFFLKTATS